MKHKLIYLLFVLVIGGLLFVQAFYQNSSAKNKVIWEYKSIYASADSGIDEFNKAGVEGWELIAIQQPNEQGRGYYYVFKRAKE